MSKEDLIKEAVEEAKASQAETDENREATRETETTLQPEGDVIDRGPLEDHEEGRGAELSDEEANSEGGVNLGEDETADTDSADASEEGKAKGFFGRKNKKDKRDEKIEELTDRLQRSMAEFDNFRKRTEKEKSQMYEIGARDIVEKILPVVDNFERGLAAVTDEERENPFVEGMEKVYKSFMTTLDDMKVKPIEAVGQPFNPDLHNAVMHVEDENEGTNTVVEEFQKGYTYRDIVVRYSMVKVAN